MKSVVQKNHLGGQFLYRSLDPSKKRRQSAMPEGIEGVIVKYGVPHALRGAVWPLLAKITPERMDELKEAFRVLNNRWSPHDQAIQRDIGRTFPAHQYFKESGEAGQEALYRVCKAYRKKFNNYIPNYFLWYSRYPLIDTFFDFLSHFRTKKNTDKNSAKPGNAP